MSKVKKTKNIIISTIGAIKKMNDDPKKTIDSLIDKNIPSVDNLFGKKIDAFIDKRKKKKENNKDIFQEMMDIAESFFTTNKFKSTDKLFSKNRLKHHAQTAVGVTLHTSKEIITSNVKKIFFTGDGICGTNTSLTGDTITIKPSEIDFLNILTIDPTSNVGQLVYESPTSNRNKQKTNLKLYNSFTGPSYQFDTNDNKTLFTSTWNSASQHYNISGLTQGIGSFNVEEFFNNYYSSIEMPDISGITKNAMLMSIQGDGSESISFNKSLNDLDRLLKKLFAVCGSSTNTDLLKNQNAVDQFNENDEDTEFYFDFDDVEGIDLDDEDLRIRKVLRFRDCNNFEIPVNTGIMEDFVYLSGKKNINDLIDSTLSKTATDIYEQSDSSVPLINFNLSILNTFILNLPKALVASVLSPKMFLPIVIIYKLIKSSVEQMAKDIMKKLSKLFTAIIKDLFWNFIREFWKLIKVDLMEFILKTVNKILKNKYKGYITTITALINLLKKTLESDINNCESLFSSIIEIINGALSTKSPFKIPNTLLMFSEQKAGFSEDKAFLNIIQRLESDGVSTAPIFGEPNNILTLVKSIIDGHTEITRTDGYHIGSNLLPIIVPTASGPATILPGSLRIASSQG